MPAIRKSTKKSKTLIPAGSGGRITAKGTAQGRPIPSGLSKANKAKESRRKTAWERKAVYEGRAVRTSSGKTKKDLVRRADGHIVTRVKSEMAKKQAHLGAFLGKGFSRRH